MFPRSNRQNEIQIDMDDVAMIMGNAYGPIEKFLMSSFCKSCREQVTIVNYVPHLDDVNDIILVGECNVCKGPVVRFIETGVSRKSASVAKHIRNVRMLVSDSKNS